MIKWVAGMIQYAQINQCDNHINKRKDSKQTITSIHAEKAFDKLQHPFMIKKKTSTK